MFLGLPEVGMSGPPSSAVVNSGTAHSSCLLAAPALPAAAPAAATTIQPPWKPRCLWSTCLPNLKWRRIKKPNTSQKQPQQLQESLHQQQAFPRGPHPPKPPPQELQQHLQQQLRIQQRRLQQLLQQQEQESQQKRYKGQQQLQQQQQRQEKRLMLLLEQADTDCLSTPYTGGGSSSNSKANSGRNSGVSVGFNVSTLGTPAYSSSHNESNSPRSVTSNSDCSSSGSSGLQPIMFSPAGQTTSGTFSLASGMSLESSMLCSNNSSRRGSQTMTIKSPKGYGGVAAAPAPGRGASAGSRCSAADAATPLDASLDAPLPVATAAGSAPRTAVDAAAGADQRTSGGATLPSEVTAIALPASGGLTGGSARSQSAIRVSGPENPAPEGKTGNAARLLSLSGAAAEATDEWDGPDVLETPAHKKDSSGQTDKQHHPQQWQPLRMPRQQTLKEQQPEFQAQPQGEQERSTGGRCWSPLASGTPRPSVLLSTPSQALIAAITQPPKAAASAVGVNVPIAVPRRGSRLLEPFATSRPSNSITDLQNQKQQQQRRHLEDLELPALPLLGGGSASAPETCSPSLRAASAVEIGDDADMRNKHVSDSSPIARDTQSRAKGVTAVVVTSSGGSVAVPTDGTVVAGTATSKELDVHASEKASQQQQHPQQQQNDQTLDATSTEMQANLLYLPQKQHPNEQPSVLEPARTPPVEAESQVSPTPQDRSERSQATVPGRSPPVSAAAAAVELAAAVVDAAASTAANAIAPSAGALVSSVTQRLSSLLTKGPPGCSLRAPRRQQHLEQQYHQLKQKQEAGPYRVHQQVLHRNSPVLPTPSMSPLQLQHTQERQLHHQVLQEQGLGQRVIQQALLEPSVPPLPVAEIQASCMLQQLSACDLRHQQQQQFQLMMQRLQASTPHASRTGTYTTTRPESPRRLKLRFSAPSKQHQLQQQLLLLQDQQKRQAPLEKKRIEKQRTVFGVHLSAAAEAAAANAAGAAAAAAAARPLCCGNTLAPFDSFVPEHRNRQAQEQQNLSEVQRPGRLQQLQPLCCPSTVAVAAERLAAPREDCCSPSGSRYAPSENPALPSGPSTAASPVPAISSALQEGTSSGRRSPAGQQAAEASRRALLLRKNSQASLLHICSAAHQDQKLQPPQLVQQQAHWETGGSQPVPLAAAAAAATAAALSQNKLAGSETSPTDLSTNSTNVTSDVPSDNSMHSALTPQLLHPCHRTPFPLQQLGTESERSTGGATATERPPTPVRAERLRKRLEKLRDMGQLSRDTYPAAEVTSLINGARVEKEGPFPVYVLDKDWSLGCSALDPDWPQKMLQNTKEGIKLHSEINKLLALAKEVDLAQAKRECE